MPARDASVKGTVSLPEKGSNRSARCFISGFWDCQQPGGEMFCAFSRGLMGCALPLCPEKLQLPISTHLASVKRTRVLCPGHLATLPAWNMQIVSLLRNRCLFYLLWAVPEIDCNQISCIQNSALLSLIGGFQKRHSLHTEHQKKSKAHCVLCYSLCALLLDIFCNYFHAMIVTLRCEVTLWTWKNN